MKRRLLSELKRRNVYRPALLYVGAVWALAQGIAQLSPVIGVPDNLFDRIHSDPRWLPFLRKLGKAPDQLARVHFKVTLPAGSAAPGGPKKGS